MWRSDVYRLFLTSNSRYRNYIVGKTTQSSKWKSYFWTDYMIHLEKKDLRILEKFGMDMNKKVENKKLY